MMPMAPTDVRLLVAIWYTDPSQLSVRVASSGVAVPDLNADPWGAQLSLPTLDSPCSSNAFVGSSRKLLMLLCGGDAGLTIDTLPQIVISIGVALSVDEFFEPATLARNLVSLFNISPSRVTVASASSTPASGRRLSEAATVQLVVRPASPCDDVNCGEHGRCLGDESAVGGRRCECEAGYGAAAGCDGLYCRCLAPLVRRALSTSCAIGYYDAGEPSGCQPCDDSCALCTAGTPFDCTACRDADRLTSSGACVPRPAVATDDEEVYAELSAVGAAISNSSASGSLDLGYTVTSVGLYVPPPSEATVSAANASIDESDAPASTGEEQRLTLLGSGLAGEFNISFNGEMTTPIDVATVDADALVAELSSLSTIGTVAVTLNRTGDEGLTALIRFTMQGQPRNEGSLPPLELHTSALSGLTTAAVSVERAASYADGYEQAEQRILLSGANVGTRSGGFTMGFGGETSASIAPDASATAVRTALSELSTIGDVEVFASSSGPSEQTYLVRFLAGGDPPHIGPMASLQLGSTLGSGVSVSLQVGALAPPTPFVPIPCTAHPSTADLRLRHELRLVGCRAGIVAL